MTATMPDLMLLVMTFNVTIPSHLLRFRVEELSNSILLAGHEICFLFQK